MYKKSPNRKYTYDSMFKRVQEAESFEELDLVMALAEQLIDSNLLTSNQYSQLQHNRNLKAMELMGL